MGGTNNIRIGHLRIMDHLILEVARQIRFRNGTPENPIGPELVPMNAWHSLFEHLVENNIDGALVPVPMALELLRAETGHRLMMLTSRGGGVIAGSRRAGVRRLGDAAGKIFLISHELSVHHMLLHNLLTSAGLKPGLLSDSGADVFFETMMPAMIPEAIAFDDRGEYAGFCVEQPFGSISLNQGAARLLCMTDKLWPLHPGCGFVLHQDRIDGHPEEVAVFIESLIQAGLELNGSPDRYRAVAADFLGQAETVIDRILSRPELMGSWTAPEWDVWELDRIQAYMVDQLKLMDHGIRMPDFVDPGRLMVSGA